MRHSVPAIGLLTVAAAAFPHSASAATWSTPVDVSSPSTFIDNPFIGFGRSGTGIAAWHWGDGVGKGSRGGERIAARTASGTFAAERPAPEVVARPVLYGSNRLAVLTQPTTIRNVRGVGRPRARIQVTFGRTDGTFGRPKTIARITPFRGPVMAANNAGDIAVAYLRTIGHRGRRLVALAVRRRGARFGRPRIISRAPANALAVAVGPRGDVVVAWEREGRIEARIRRRGRGLGRVIRVGSGVKLGTRLRAAIGRRGRVWIAWSSQRLAGGENGPFTLQSAVSYLRRYRFARPRPLDRHEGRAHDEASFDLALDGDDNGFIAWSTFLGGRFRARLASADRSGHFSRSIDLSQTTYDAVVSDLATSRRSGEAIVVWSRLDDVREVGTNVLAGYLPPTAAYPGEELISRGDRARVPAVAFDPATGLPTAVWSQREGPDGPGVPLEQIRTFLRASTRTP
jgi:hypothetical protein